MQKYYIYNNKAFNEFLTIIQSETQPNILLSYTTVEYPSTEAGYTRCFDSNTNTWSEQIEDNRNIIVYNINDSSDTKIITQLGAIPAGYTSIKPTDNISKKFDTTKNEWYLEAGLTQVNYADIKNKPTIPTKLSQLNNDAGFITEYTEADPVYTADKPNLALKSELPTKLSELTNDEGYIKYYTQTDPIYTADKPNLALKSQIPTKTSDLTNDSGYITSFTESDPIYEADKPNLALKTDVPTNLSELNNDIGFIKEYTETDPIYSADKPNLALKTDVPTKLSELNNDAEFITSSELNDTIITSNQHIPYSDIFQVYLKYDVIKVNDILYFKQQNSIANKWLSESNIVYTSSAMPEVNQFVYSDVNCIELTDMSISQVKLNQQRIYKFTQSEVGIIRYDGESSQTSLYRKRQNDLNNGFCWENLSDSKIVCYTNKYEQPFVLYEDETLSSSLSFGVTSYANPKWTTENAELYYQNQSNDYSMLNITIQDTITQTILCKPHSGYLPYPSTLENNTYLYNIPVIVKCITTNSEFDSELVPSINVVKTFQNVQTKTQLLQIQNQLNKLNQKVVINSTNFATDYETYEGKLTDKAVSPANVMYALDLVVQQKVNQALSGINASLDELNGN